MAKKNIHVFIITKGKNMLTKTSLEFLQKRFNKQSVLQVAQKTVTQEDKPLMKYAKCDIFESLYAKDFLKKPEEEIKIRLRALLKTKPYDLGNEADFFIIDKTGYGLRKRMNTKPDLKERINFEITDKDRMNHVVAKIGDDVEILRFIEGKNTFVDYGSYDDIPKKKQTALNEKMLNFPSIAYEKLILRLMEAGKHNQLFDEEGRNIIANLSKKRFMPFDFQNYSKSEPIGFNPIVQIHDRLTAYNLKQQIHFLKKLVGGFVEVVKPEKKLPIPASRIVMGVSDKNLRFNELKDEDIYKLYKNLIALNSEMAELKTIRTEFESLPNNENKKLLQNQIDKIKISIEERLGENNYQW